jgi:hypothetical protein
VGEGPGGLGLAHRDLVLRFDEEMETFGTVTVRTIGSGGSARSTRLAS